MIEEAKQWGDLTFLEQTLRDIRANKGRAYRECGRPVSEIGTCRECIEKFIEEIRQDTQEG